MLLRAGDMWVHLVGPMGQIGESNTKGNKIAASVVCLWHLNSLHSFSYICNVGSLQTCMLIMGVLITWLINTVLTYIIHTVWLIWYHYGLLNRQSNRRSIAFSSTSTVKYCVEILLHNFKGNKISYSMLTFVTSVL